MSEKLKSWQEGRDESRDAIARDRQEKGAGMERDV